MDDELKNEAYKDIEIIYEDENVMFVEILSKPAGKYFGSQWFITNYMKNYNPFYYGNQKDIYFIVDNNNPGATWTIFIEDNKVDIRSESGRHETTEELEEAFPEIFSIVKEKIGPTSLYECLLLISEGKKVSDSLIEKFDSRVEININSSKPEKSRVFINFDSIDDFVRTVLKDEEDIYYVKNILNRNFYSISDDLTGKYYINDDWDEGYVIEYFFSDENKKLLNKILLYVAPHLYNSDDYKKISTIFDAHFYSSDITDELWERSYEAKGEQEYKEIKLELCDKLLRNKVITLDCFYNYLTSTDNLIKLMEKYGTEKNFSDIFKYVYQDVYDSSGYYENLESGVMGPIDRDSFDSYIEDKLDNILSKLQEESDLEDESSLEGYHSVSNFRKELSDILSKFNMAQSYNLKGKEFKIISIDEKNKKLIVDVYGSGRRSYTPEEFNDFLYNLELFESIVRKIKNNLLY